MTILREPYRFRDSKADVIAGLTVAIVALPLSMAIATASGVTLFSEVTDSLTITATAKAVFLRAKSSKAQRQMTIGSASEPVAVFGTKSQTGRLASYSQISL